MNANHTSIYWRYFGSGKTLSLVKFAYERWLKGQKIYTNFNLSFSKNNERITMLDIKFFEDYTTSKLNFKDAIVLIDEAHVFFDSRNAMMKRNKIFSRFVTQSRKRGVDLCISTQDKSPELFFRSGQVELRLRKLTDYVIFCECIKVKGEKIIVNTVCDRYGAPLKKTITKARPYYKLYDTYELVDFDTHSD